MLKERRILALCEKNKGKNLVPEVIKQVINFYQNDDNSQMCTGRKDSVAKGNKDGKKE